METCGKASALSWEICGRILVKKISCASYLLETLTIAEASSVERKCS